MNVWSPIATGSTEAARLAARPRTLPNLTIGVLDNSKPNADVLLHRVAALVAERTGAECAPGAHVVLTGSAG